MTTEVVHTYTFNRPVTVVFLLPLLFLMVLFGDVVLHQFNALALVMVILTLLMTFALVYFSFFRTLKIGGGKAIWRTPFQRYELNLADLKHFGVIKFRRFRFAYISKSELPPFAEPSAQILSGPDTFLIQFRPGAWEFIETSVKSLHPQLKPDSIVRQ